MEVLSLFGDPWFGSDVWIGFNSKGACASVNHLHFHVCNRTWSVIGDEKRIMIERAQKCQIVGENELYTLHTSIHLDCHMVALKLSQPLS